MKISIKKIIITLLFLIIINLPFFILLNKNDISFEQPDANLVFEEMIHLSENENQTKEQGLNIKRNNLSGFSLVTFSGKFFNNIHLKLQIAEKNQPDIIIREESYRLRLDYLYQIQRLTFEPIRSSENKDFIIKITDLDDNKHYSIANAQENKSYIALRPLYFENKAADNIYYRTSQYKPAFIKGYFALITLILFNIFLGIFLFKITNKKDS